jgi:hypothetical protein
VQPTTDPIAQAHRASELSLEIAVLLEEATIHDRGVDGHEQRGAVERFQDEARGPLPVARERRPGSFGADQEQ